VRAAGDAERGVPGDEPADLPSCVLLDQATIDTASAAIGQPRVLQQVAALAAG
jgi:hypothetical protein